MRAVGVLVVGFLIFVSSSQAAFDYDFCGAESAAMGGSSAALESSLGVSMVNPASLSLIKSQQIEVSGVNLYPGLTEGLIAKTTAGYAHVGSELATGISWAYLNAAGLYTENQVVLSVARYFTRASFGLSASLMNWDVAPTIRDDGTIIEDIDGKSTISFGLGFRFKASDVTSVSASILNVNRPNIASDVSSMEDRLPLIGRLGVGVVTEKGRWGIDIVFRETEIDVRTGMERKIGESFAVRFGMRLENMASGINLTGGLGYRVTESTRINYALVYPLINLHAGVGSHSVSIVYDY